jgi:rubredoxin
MLKCKNCGLEFESKGVVSDNEQILKTNTFTEISESCPSCGQDFIYNTPDFYWK